MGPGLKADCIREALENYFSGLDIIYSLFSQIYIKKSRIIFNNFRRTLVNSLNATMDRMSYMTMIMEFISVTYVVFYLEHAGGGDVVDVVDVPASNYSMKLAKHLCLLYQLKSSHDSIYNIILIEILNSKQITS